MTRASLRLSGSSPNAVGANTEPATPRIPSGCTLGAAMLGTNSRARGTLRSSGRQAAMTELHPERVAQERLVVNPQTGEILNLEAVVTDGLAEYLVAARTTVNDLRHDIKAVERE